MALKIVTLDRQPVRPGDTRYMIDSDRPAEDGYVIILDPITPDDLLAPGPEAYGTLRVVTAYGVRTVTTVVAGVLVINED